MNVLTAYVFLSTLVFVFLAAYWPDKTWFGIMLWLLSGWGLFATLICFRIIDIR